MECLICSDPIRHAHLGVNSCRACAVFYKRTADAKRKLKCKGGSGECRKINPKTSCRLCRYTRFSEILKSAGGKIVDIKAGIELTLDDFNVDSDETIDSTFLSHESFYDCEPSTSRTPLLDRLRKGYSLMCLIRYSGEIANRSKGDKQTEIRIGKLVLVRASYSTILHHTKLCREGVKAFANQAFDDFRELDDESKEFIIETVRGCCGTLDGAYRAAHHFPNKDDVRTPGYTTYMDFNNLEHFFADCTDDVDCAKIISECRKGFEKTGKATHRYFKKINPTDVEFLALLGLSLWNDEIPNLSERVHQISMRYRSLIMKELHSYYCQQGKTDYAVRIGHLFCVLVHIQVSEILNFHLRYLAHVKTYKNNSISCSDRVL
ncbi:hypothetical protein PMAYCL1PPCAC_16536 [Pristionchus mayeri]|uniref:Nuclear receptor n=1 Tax=Pristionchus mayeri TaxID=1317129 RepID=A0AAN5CKW8_9BILA|nr:hypothetical protein PMAYCL1PPCAC_16536 [Pristionchus mayeri]